MEKIFVPKPVSESSPSHIGEEVVVVAAMMTSESEAEDDVDSAVASAATALVLQPNTMDMIN